MGISESDRIAAALSYIDALVTHDANGVPFAPNCTRTEVGIKTGFSGEHLRRSLNRGLQYRIITAHTEPEFTTSCDEVRARFDIITAPTFAGRRVCAHVDETFLIPEAGESGRAQIMRIRASIRPFIQR